MNGFIKMSACVLALFALSATTLQARTTLKVRANQPAEVFLDGRRMGVTPLKITRLRGRHDLRMRSTVTGEEQRRQVRAGGRRRHRVETVHAHFSRAYPSAFHGYYRPWGYGYRHDRWHRRHDWRR